ncbi:MAG: GNAT family N-acetyltransferase [Candidatus Thiodiazotropha sp.]
MITWKTLPNITGCHTHSLAWQAGVSFDSNLYAMYHSLDWLSCLDNPQHDTISIAEHCRDGATTFAAFKKRKIPLNFRLSRRLNFTSDLSVLELLGCDLVGKNSYSSLKAIANSVWNDFRSVDAIYLKSVNVGSSIWQTFSDNNWRVDNALVYMPDTERTFHYVDSIKTHQEYIDGFKSKQRISFKRKIKKINEAFPGKVEIHRIDYADDLDYLTLSAKQIVQNSWKMHSFRQPIPESINNQQFLRQVTENGFLRSHVLSLDGVPCAFTVGFLCNGIYHCADTAYDINYAKYSPGTVLLYLAIEDIINSDQAKVIHFGITDAQYKRELCNCHTRDVSLMIMRPTFTNKVRISLHRTYRDSRAWLKSRKHPPR